MHETLDKYLSLGNTYGSDNPPRTITEPGVRENQLRDLEDIRKLWSVVKPSGPSPNQIAARKRHDQRKRKLSNRTGLPTGTDSRNGHTPISEQHDSGDPTSS